MTSHAVQSDSDGSSEGYFFDGLLLCRACAMLEQYLSVNSDVPKMSGCIYLKSSRCFFLWCVFVWLAGFSSHTKRVRGAISSVVQKI